MTPALQYVVKVVVTAALVVAISEIGKRNSFWGAVLASLPVTSLLAFAWMRRDGAGTEQVAARSTSIFWLVLPSLVLFVLFPVLLRVGVDFTVCLLGSCVATAAGYALMAFELRND